MDKFLVALRRLWWLPCVTLVLGLGASIIFLWWKPPTFVSGATMYETDRLRLPDGPYFVEATSGPQNDELKSSYLRQRALEAISATNSVLIPRDPLGKPLEVEIRVTQAPKAPVFLLEASGTSPFYVQSYLDALMGVYLDYKRTMRKEVSGGTLASVTEQVQKAERERNAEQDMLNAYKRTNNLAVLEEEGRIAGGYLARLKTQLSDYQLELRLLSSAALQGTNSTSTNEPALDLASISSGTGGNAASAQAGERQSTFKELELLKIQRDRLSKNLRPKHPKMVKLEADLERAEKLIEVYRLQSLEQIAATRNAVQLKIENVQSSIGEWQDKVVEANSRIADAERLKLNVQRAEGVYDRLTLLLQNVDMGRNISQETLAILDHASFPKRTYSREIGGAALGCFGGLGLGLGIVFAVMLRDDRFHSLADISENLPELVVGQVPDLASLSNGSNGATLPLLQLDDPRHAYAESFRSLRSSLLFMPQAEKRPQVILITSAIPNEGKSTVCVNLARTLAQGGAGVVLIDGDLRKGGIHRLLKAKREPGLSELLKAPEKLDEALQIIDEPRISFISAGKNIVHSGDLFLGRAFDATLARLRERFDYVLIDSSPVFAADDAATVAPKADGTLFIVRNRYSGARLVREALELLYQRQAKVLGIVFNAADARAASYHYYKYAQYYPQPEAFEKAD